MLTPDDVRMELRRQPFVPFRLHLTDGRTFEVRHPDMVLVMSRSLVVGIIDPPGSTYPERNEVIALMHVVSLEPLRQTA
jgi:hypothetical protein